MSTPFQAPFHSLLSGHCVWLGWMVGNRGRFRAHGNIATALLSPRQYCDASLPSPSQPHNRFSSLPSPRQYPNIYLTNTSPSHPSRVSRHPNPLAPGVPGSGRPWALGAAAYIACWAAWLIFVVILYEVVYSFARRWRLSTFIPISPLPSYRISTNEVLVIIERPLILPIYLSSPGFSLACIGSYTRFCFLQHIRWSGFTTAPPPSPYRPVPTRSSSASSTSSTAPSSSSNGSFLGMSSVGTGLAESAWFYSQNTPTICLLLPRLALSLALLLSFSSANPQVGILVREGLVGGGRDGTWFEGEGGTLSVYARGVLWANVGWGVWRVGVLIISWCVGFLFGC